MLKSCKTFKFSKHIQYNSPCKIKSSVNFTHIIQVSFTLLKSESSQAKYANVVAKMYENEGE